MMYEEVVDAVDRQIQQAQTALAQLQKQKDDTMRNFDLRMKPLQDRVARLSASKGKEAQAKPGQPQQQPGKQAGNPMPDAQPAQASASKPVGIA